MTYRLNEMLQVRPSTEDAIISIQVLTPEGATRWMNISTAEFYKIKDILEAGEKQ